MAGLEGLGKDDLKRVLDIRAAVKDVKSEINYRTHAVPQTSGVNCLG